MFPGVNIYGSMKNEKTMRLNLSMEMFATPMKCSKRENKKKECNCNIFCKFCVIESAGARVKSVFKNKF